VVAGLLIAAAMFAVKPDLLASIMDKVRSVPSITPDADASARGAGFHTFTLASHYGWVVTLFPLLVLLVVRLRPWLTTFLVLWFTIPLLANSLFFARKEERLILLAVPALFILAGLALAEAREMVGRAVNLYAREWLPSYRSAVRVGEAVVWFLVAFALLTLPALGVATRIPQTATAPRATDWAALVELFSESQNSANLPVGSPDPLGARFYLGRVDFAVGALLGALPSEMGDRLPAGRFRVASDSVARESLTGSFLTPTLDLLKSAYVPYGVVHVVVDSRLIHTPAVSPFMCEELLARGAELCRGRCGSLNLYRLTLVDSGSAASGLQSTAADLVSKPPPTAGGGRQNK
jgi:hypothetical protein